MFRDVVEAYVSYYHGAMASPHIHSGNPTGRTGLAGLLSERPDWFAKAVTTAGAASVCTAVALRDPREEGSFAVCPWLFLTGTQCPGCGILRSLNRMVGGDIEGALGYNVMWVIAVPIMIYSWVRWVLPAKFANFLPTIRPDRRLAAVLVFAGILVVFGVLRNLPWEPFTWLHPTK